MILPDSLAPNLKLLFCGTAASGISAQEAAYYANPTNYFWRTLYQIGLTPRQFRPQEFPKLLEYGIGLTDVAKGAVGNDSDLTSRDFDAKALHQKILQYQPKMFAFTSKKAASVFFETSTTKIYYGLQENTVGVTKFWVLTSPSGSARRYWDVKVWQALAKAVGKMPDK